MLILSQYYTPEPVPRPSELALGLFERGFKVSVLTGFPNYPDGKIYPGYRQSLFLRETVDGIPVTRIPLYPDHSESIFKRSFNFLSFALSASCFGPSLIRNVDLVFAFAGGIPLGIPAWWISLLQRAPFVFAIHDIWPETLVVTGMLKNRVAIGALGSLERFIYRRAAAVGVLSEGFRKNLLSKGVQDAKIRIISNWVDERMYHRTSPEEGFGRQLGLSGKFNVMFAGNFGLAQALGTVLDAAELTKDLPNLQYVLVGDGVEKTRLEKDASRRGLGNVLFIGRWPAREMARIFSLADVMLVHLRKDPIYLLTVPSKTYTYLACGKPVLMAIEGDGADLVQKANAGLVCPSEDPEAMADTVRVFYRMPEEERVRLGANAYIAYERNFRKEDLIDRYADLFRELVVSQRNGRE